MLALLDWNKVFLLETEVIENGIGEVLLQDQKSIAYLSKALGMIYIIMKGFTLGREINWDKR